MNTQDITVLFGYNEWASRLILNAAERVPAQQYAQAQLGYCRLRRAFGAPGRGRAALARALAGQAKCANASPGGGAGSGSSAPGVGAQQQLMRAYLASLSDTDLTREISYQRLNGDPIANTLWRAMAHLVNHGTQHRAELALLLTELGCSPGDLNLVIYVRELGQAQ